MSAYLLKLSRAEELYGISSRTLRQCCVGKKIIINGERRPFKGIKIGKDWYIDEKELKKHLSEVKNGN